MKPLNIIKIRQKPILNSPFSGHEHLPLVMTCSVSSNNSAEEATLCESPPPSPRRRLDSTDDEEEASFSASSDVLPRSCRPSRHRPLKMCVAAPTLKVFEAKPMAAMWSPLPLFPNNKNQTTAFIHFVSPRALRDFLFSGIFVFSDYFYLYIG